MEENGRKLETMEMLVKQLTSENETLYHQLNHMMIRNNTLLKRIDDLQQAINDLHIRLEESNLINNNLIKSNDRRNVGFDNKNDATSLLRSEVQQYIEKDSVGNIDLEELYQKWKSFPGQEARNEPNIRKQSLMMAHLYSKGNLSASDLFSHSGTGAVTGARYVATLKKFKMIEYTGARKKGHYRITSMGRQFVESGFEPTEHHAVADTPETNTLLQGIPMQGKMKVPTINMLDHYDL
jgi:predicted transcriptional regulator